MPANNFMYLYRVGGILLLNRIPPTRLGYAVIKGEAISKSNNYRIKTELVI